MGCSTTLALHLVLYLARMPAYCRSNAAIARFRVYVGNDKIGVLVARCHLVRATRMKEMANVLPNLQQQSVEALQKRIAELEAENAKRRAANTGPVTCRVAAKGGLSVYGLGRWPVTLYASQWERLLSVDTVSRIRAALTNHSTELKRKELQQAA